MAQYYAWSEIHGAKVTAVGEKVDQKTLGVDDAEWAALVDQGVVRTRKYPSGANSDESPREYSLRRLAELQDEAGAELLLDDEDEDAEETPAK